MHLSCARLLLVIVVHLSVLLPTDNRLKRLDSAGDCFCKCAFQVILFKANVTMRLDSKFQARKLCFWKLGSREGQSSGQTVDVTSQKIYCVYHFAILLIFPSQRMSHKGGDFTHCPFEDSTWQPCPIHVWARGAVIRSVYANHMMDLSSGLLRTFVAYVERNTSARPVRSCSKPTLYKWVPIGCLDRELFKRLTLNKYNLLISHYGEKYHEVDRFLQVSKAAYCATFISCVPYAGISVCFHMTFSLPQPITTSSIFNFGH